MTPIMPVRPWGVKSPPSFLRPRGRAHRVQTIVPVTIIRIVMPVTIIRPWTPCERRPVLAGSTGLAWGISCSRDRPCQRAATIKLVQRFNERDGKIGSLLPTMQAPDGLMVDSANLRHDFHPFIFLISALLFLPILLFALEDGAATDCEPAARPFRGMGAALVSGATKRARRSRSPCQTYLSLSLGSAQLLINQ